VVGTVIEAPTEASYCPRCGDAAADHPECRIKLAYEPPRYCADCGRRLVVQVTPAGWTAKCSQHGTSSS
jgi:hypothetical protein